MVLTLDRMDHLKVKQMRMFRDNERAFWEDVLEALQDSTTDDVEEKYRLIAILVLRYVPKWDEEWIARAFGIDISNVSRMIEKGVRMMRLCDREMLTRRAVDVVTIPVDVIEQLVEASKQAAFVNPLVDDAIRKALNALDEADGRGDELEVLT